MSQQPLVKVAKVDQNSKLLPLSNQQLSSRKKLKTHTRIRKACITNPKIYKNKVLFFQPVYPIKFNLILLE